MQIRKVNCEKRSSSRNEHSLAGTHSNLANTCAKQKMDCLFLGPPLSQSVQLNIQTYPYGTSLFSEFVGVCIASVLRCTVRSHTLSFAFRRNIFLEAIKAYFTREKLECSLLQFLGRCVLRTAEKCCVCLAVLIPKERYVTAQTASSERYRRKFIFPVKYAKREVLYRVFIGGIVVVK